MKRNLGYMELLHEKKRFALLYTHEVYDHCCTMETLVETRRKVSELVEKNDVLKEENEKMKKVLEEINEKCKEMEEKEEESESESVVEPEKCNGKLNRFSCGIPIVFKDELEEGVTRCIKCGRTYSQHDII